MITKNKITTTSSETKGKENPSLQKQKLLISHIIWFLIVVVRQALFQNHFKTTIRLHSQFYLSRSQSCSNPCSQYFEILSFIRFNFGNLEQDQRSKKKSVSLMVQSSKDTILHSIRYTLFSRFIPLFRVTGKTFEIFVNKIRAFLISMYSVDSRHCMSNLVILWLHFQCTQNCNYKVNTEYLPLKNK